MSGGTSEAADHHDTSHYSLIFVVICLGIGVFARRVLDRFKLPYTVILLLLGAIAETLNMHTSILGEEIGASFEMWARISPELVLYAFLPALLFGSALNADYHVFRRNLSSVLLLAVPGVLMASFLTALFALGVFDWSWSAAMVFGSMLSATDPVAVVALLQDLGVSKRFSLLIEGESLLNDGTAMVVWIVAKDFLVGEDRSIIAVAGFFSQLSFGGFFLGWAAGELVARLLGLIIADALSEITLTVFAAYGLFILAEMTTYHVSGVLAVVVMGLIISSEGKTKIYCHEAMHHVWHQLEYIANTIIFVLSGVIMVSKVLSDDSHIGVADWFHLLALYICLHIVRGIVVASLFPLLKRLGYGLDWKQGVVLVHSGLRGAVGLSLALIINETTAIDAEVREKMMFHMCGIAALTLLINGSTAGLWIDYFKMSKASAESRKVFANAVSHLNSQTETAVEKLQHDEFHRLASWNMVWNYMPVLSDAVLQSRIEGSKISAKQAEIARARVGEIDSKFLKESAAAGAANEKERFLVEARLRFSNLLKCNYWHQFETGFVNGDSASDLIESANSVIDKSLEPMKDWEEMEGGCHIPQGYSKMMRVPVLRYLVRGWVFKLVAYSYDMCVGFIHAHEMIQDHFMELVNEDVGLQVLKESEINTKKARKFLAVVHEEYPEVCRSIQSQHAVRSLLHFQDEKAEEMLTHGEVDEKEYNLVAAELLSARKLMAFHPPELALPPPRELLQHAHLLFGVDQATCSAVLDNAKEMFFDASQSLFNQGDDPSGVYFIIRGSVAITHQFGEDASTASTVEVVGRGSVVGALGCVDSQPHLVSARAESLVHAFFLSSSLIQDSFRGAIAKEEARRLSELTEAVCSSPASLLTPVSCFERNLTRIAAFRVCQMVLSAFSQTNDLEMQQLLSQACVLKPVAGKPIVLRGKVIVLAGGVESGLSDGEGSEQFFEVAGLPARDYRYLGELKSESGSFKEGTILVVIPPRGYRTMKRVKAKILSSLLMSKSVNAIGRKALKKKTSLQDLVHDQPAPELPDSPPALHRSTTDPPSGRAMWKRASGGDESSFGVAIGASRKWSYLKNVMRSTAAFSGAGEAVQKKRTWAELTKALGGSVEDGADGPQRWKKSRWR